MYIYIELSVTRVDLSAINYVSSLRFQGRTETTWLRFIFSHNILKLFSA